MKPQPPVTKMRIDALPSSGAESARGEIAAPEPLSLGERLRRIDWTPWLILALGTFLRFLLLSMKPPHFDEGINGWFVDQMRRTGFYRYDPTNYHGPFHFYVLFLTQTLFGRHIWALRLPVVLASIGALWVTLRFEPFVGRKVSRIAAAAMAVSPGFIFYGRYAIHEVWLLLFSMLFVLELVGLWKRGTRGYLWCAGMGTAGMILTKETYIIHIGCAAIAAGVLWISHLLTPLPDLKRAPRQWHLADLAMMIAAALGLIVFFYSGTFLNLPGLRGLYETFATWYQTGSKGNGHEKPWPYWFELIVRYEWPVLIGLTLCLACQFFRNFVIRYLAIYGVGVLAAYSIVNYKTPWCIISIVWPFLFVFAAGAAAVRIPRKAFCLAGGAVLGLGVGVLASYLFQPSAVRGFCSLPHYLGAAFKVMLAASSTSPTCGEMGQRLFGVALGFALLGGGLGYLAGGSLKLSEATTRATQMAAAGLALLMSLVLAIYLNYFACTTETEPYVYVQTYNDIYRLTGPVMKLAGRDPTYYSMVGHLIRTSTYPFPWLLGDFPNVGYYEHDNSPGKMDADFLLVQEDRIAEVEKKLHESYFTAPLTIRPYQDPSKLYLNTKTFGKIMRGVVPGFVGKPEPAPAAPLR
ncbi:MAG: flippase activity-associated protein Agl23 [Chthoniobacterales bacterium]